MKKFIVFAAAIMLTVSAFAKPGDGKKRTKKNCTTECKCHCDKTKCPVGCN